MVTPTPTTVQVKIQLRGDTAANWASVNPTLLANEVGRETDTGKIKVGNGTTAWNSLAYQPWGSLITDADVAADAAIAGSKISPDFGSQTVTTTGVFSADDGTAAAPGITFTGDTNTGIYSPGADQLALSTNGLEAIRINSSGYLALNRTNFSGAGICTRELDSTLSLGGGNNPLNSGANFALSGPSQAGANAGYLLRDGTANKYAWNRASDYHAWTTGGSERLRITSAGLVGIGTSAPGASLQINAPAASSGHDLLKLVNGADAAELVIDTSANVINFKPGTGDSLAFWDASSERLRITSAGLVGIGTSAPDAELEVVATSPEIKSRAAGNSSGKLSTDSNRAASVIGGQILGRWNGNTVARIDFINGADGTNKDDGEIAFATANNASNPLERMRITQAGNVGIGTTSPGDLLHVMESSASAAAAFTASVAQFERNGSCAITISSTDAATGSIFFGDTASAGIGRIQFDHSDNSLQFWSSLERARIDSSGRLLVGTSTSVQVPLSSPTLGDPGKQLAGTGQAGATCAQYAYSTSPSVAPNLILARSRGALNAQGLVADDDALGRVIFQGSDGQTVGTNSGFIRAAQISAEVDGTPGANDMPGRLVFSVTADGASSPTEAMRIKNSRILNFANTPVYADNAAAKTGGLVDGDVYRKSDGTLMIVYT